MEARLLGRDGSSGKKTRSFFFSRQTSSFQDKLAKQHREQKWKYFELFSDDNYLKCQGIEEGKKKKVSRKFSLKRKAEKVCDICNLKTTVVLGNSGTTNKNIKTKIELCRTQITSHKGIVGISHEVKIFLCSLRWSAQGEGDSSFVNLSTPVPQFNKMSPQSNILLPKVLSFK